MTQRFIIRCWAIFIFIILITASGLSCKNAPRAVAKGGEKTPPQAQAPDKPAPAPGPFTECPEGMARIPAGTFIMGDAETPHPVHWRPKPREITITRDYCMDITEVTQSAFNKVMGFNPSFFKTCGPQCPVETVTWTEADAFCRKLGKRLPTNAEWERAARAGTTTPYWWGREDDGRYMWYRNNAKVDYDLSYCDWCGPMGNIGPHPVGLKLPNPYGLHDMAGNITEWVQDYIPVDWPKHLTTVDPVNNKSFLIMGREVKGLRGGDFADFGIFAYLYNQDGMFIDERLAYGFRCAATLVKQGETKP